MEFEPIKVVQNKFYFGIGGIGDFLLLMSTFYDTIDDRTDVIFVANNIATIRELSKKFPKVERFWFFPRKAFVPTPYLWNEIVNHKGCLGTGVTPKEFNYVGDWIECGKSNVFSYYGVKHNPIFARSIDPIEDYICIQPFGGADDPTKKKEISPEEVQRLILDAWDYGYKVKLIGSKKDAEKLQLNRTTPDLEWEKAVWVTDICESYELIRGCKKFYGADSWGKTVACFAGKNPTVYDNQYSEGYGPMELFNHPVDPGNYVFLIGWDLEVINGK